jgi:hypothetical protein
LEDQITKLEAFLARLKREPGKTAISLIIILIVLVFVSIFSSFFSEVGRRFASHETPQRDSVPSFEDPVKKITSLNIPFTEESYFQMVQIGRADVVSLFLSAGFSPYAKTKLSDTLDGKSQSVTALAIAIAKHSPRICEMLKIYSDQGVDLTNPMACGLDWEGTLLDHAIANDNYDAIACLAPLHSDLSEYVEVVRRRLDFKKRLLQLKSNDFVHNASTNCVEDNRALFGVRKSQLPRLPDYYKNQFSQSSYNICNYRSAGLLREFLSGAGDDIGIRSDEIALSILNGNPIPASKPNVTKSISFPITPTDSLQFDTEKARESILRSIKANETQ